MEDISRDRVDLPLRELRAVLPHPVRDLLEELIIQQHPDNVVGLDVDPLTLRSPADRVKLPRIEAAK